MKLKIIGPEGTQIHEILWVELNTKAGNFVIQPGHHPMVVSLDENKEVAFCLKTGKQSSFSPPGGVAEITRNSITLLLTQMPA